RRRSSVRFSDSSSSSGVWTLGTTGIGAGQAAIGRVEAVWSHWTFVHGRPHDSHVVPRGVWTTVVAVTRPSTDDPHRLGTGDPPPVHRCATLVHRRPRGCPQSFPQPVGSGGRRWRWGAGARTGSQPTTGGGADACRELLDLLVDRVLL